MTPKIGFEMTSMIRDYRSGAGLLKYLKKTGREWYHSRMEEGFTRKEQLVGGFLLVLIVFTMVTLLVIAQGKGWFQRQNTYLIKFRQGYNLHQGSLVKIFNAEIGKVAMLRIIQTMGHPPGGGHPQGQRGIRQSHPPGFRGGSGEPHPDRQ